MLYSMTPVANATTDHQSEATERLLREAWSTPYTTTEADNAAPSPPNHAVNAVESITTPPKAKDKTRSAKLLLPGFGRLDQRPGY